MASGARRQRGGGDGGGARGAGRKKRAVQLDQVPPSHYTDADEALEAGIELEEKAERFAVGDKARKYYELAADVYARSWLLSQRRSADAAYNFARVRFVLATAFCLPPASVGGLREAIQSYTDTLSLVPPLEAGEERLPSAFYLDVQFNLAIALITLAEQLDRLSASYPAPSEQEPSTLIQQAIQHLENVLDGQELVLRHQQQQELDNAQADVERAPLYADADGAIEGSSEEHGQEAAETAAGQSSNVRAEYTSSLITPSSALETVANLHGAAITLLDASEDAETERMIRAQCMLYQARGQSVFTTYPDGERRSPDNEWNVQVSALRFAPLELKVASLSQSGQQQEIASLLDAGNDAQQEANSLLQQVASSTFDLTSNVDRAAQEVVVEQVERLAGLLSGIARIYLERIYFSVSAADAAALAVLVPHAWQLLAQCSKLLLTASKALDSSAPGQASIAVLGSAQSSTPTTRRRCALFTSLSMASSLRGDLVRLRTGLIPDLNEGATMTTLLDNARVYARKALAEVGLAWLLQEQQLTRTYAVPPGGLDSLLVDVEAVLALLRSLSVRAMTLDDAGRAAAVHECTTLCTNLIGAMLNARSGDSALCWKACLGLANTQSQEAAPTLGQGLIEQAFGQEGEGGISPEQRSFWSQVDFDLTRHG